MQFTVEQILASSLRGWTVLIDPRGASFSSLAVKLDLRLSEVRALVDLNSKLSFYSWDDLYRDTRIRVEKVHKHLIMVHWDTGKAPTLLTNGGKNGPSRSAVVYLQLNDQRLLDIAGDLMTGGKAKAPKNSAASASSAAMGTVGGAELRSGVPLIHSSEASASAAGLVGGGRRPGSTVSFARRSYSS